MGTALAGRSKERPELAATPIPLTARLTAVPCRGDETLIERLFAPLGYQTATDCGSAGADAGRYRNLTTARKTALALREFALGVEALERFTGHAPLSQVHEAVFGVLALESEPVDPRL